MARKARVPRAAGRRSESARPRVNLAESPLAWLRSRRDGDGNPLISEVQFDAGERLRADFWFAQMVPSVTSRWDFTGAGSGVRRASPGAGVELADNVMAAAERVRRALAAVGPELDGVLIDVCCHLKGLEDVERRAGWPQRSAKIVVRIALERLAHHYGLATERREPRGPAHIRHWGGSDYRPSITSEEDGPES
jgi:hypothetical protein